MKLHAIAVRDLATETFGRPFFVPHPAQAVRSFTDEVNNPESEVSRHAKDYELWSLGRYEETTGLFENQAERLVRAIDLQKGA